MHTAIAELEQAQIRSDIPDFRPGDTLKVHVRVTEGTRSRIQVFQGIVIRRQGGGARETFTVRKISYGVGQILPGATAEQVLAEADAAMYAHKRLARAAIGT